MNGTGTTSTLEAGEIDILNVTKMQLRPTTFVAETVGHASVSVFEQGPVYRILALASVTAGSGHGPGRFSENGFYLRSGDEHWLI